MASETKAKLDTLLETIKAQTTTIEGIDALIQGLHDQIAALPIPPELVAKIDEVFEAAKANDQALADAIAVNVPPEPPPE